MTKLGEEYERRTIIPRPIPETVPQKGEPNREPAKTPEPVVPEKVPA